MGSLVGGSSGGQVHSRWLSCSREVTPKSMVRPCLGHGLTTVGACGIGGSVYTNNNLVLVFFCFLFFASFYYIELFVIRLPAFTIGPLLRHCLK